MPPVREPEIADVHLDRSGNYDCPLCGAVNAEVGIHWAHENGRLERFCSSPVCQQLMSDEELAAYRAALPD